MYLIMEDKSIKAEFGLELGFSNMRFVEIPDELLEILSSSFIKNFKKVLKNNKFAHINKSKTIPANSQVLCLGCLVEMNRESISSRYEDIWEKDVQTVLSCFSHH